MSQTTSQAFGLPVSRLPADVGGTDARFAWQADANAPLTDIAVYRCADHDSLQAALCAAMSGQIVCWCRSAVKAVMSACLRMTHEGAAFCSLLGSVAGDLALALGARGGVHLGGGIAPRITQQLKGSLFRERFVAKGRFRSYLQGIPTLVIDSKVPAALIGAARAF